MTPTDVQGWIDSVPLWLVLAGALLTLTAILEETPRGRRIADWIIEWITR